MRDPERVRRSNRVLIGLVILILLYGLITRIQTGDTTLYLFGQKIELPFATQQEAPAETEAAEGAAEESGK